MKKPMNKTLKILAIESSCDDTSIAFLLAKGGLAKPTFKILSLTTASQTLVHSKFGGVVPEVAAREHAVHIAPAIEKVLRDVKNIKPDYIAVTHGPGLITSLMVGINAAKTTALAKNIPAVGVNHIEGHLYSVLLGGKQIKFPAIALIVSGGHTELIFIKDYCNYKKIGQTLDDAAGECFDKIGKIMGLPYPGGPEISKLASTAGLTKKLLPRPMFNSPDFNFSFAGLKTAALYYLRDNKKILDNKKDLAIFAVEVEQAIIDCLINKSLKAVKKYNPKTFILSGGVSANKLLRFTLPKYLPKEITFLMPELGFTTDNAAMIGAASYIKVLKKGMPQKNSWKKLNGDPELSIG